MFSTGFITAIALILVFVLGIAIGSDSSKMERNRLTEELRKVSSEYLQQSRKLSKVHKELQMHKLLDGE